MHMASTQLLPEHNSACERARLSSCHCYCHGAGHQHDLIKRAVSCTPSGVNNLQQLNADLRDIYGGFRADLRDAETPARRPVPEDLEHLNLDRGRGASWVEKLLVDEALHSAFVRVANASTRLSDADRSQRYDFVVDLASEAMLAVGGDVDSHNICDGHLWCSVVAQANAHSEEPQPTTTSPGFGQICYPRARRARVPASLARTQQVASRKTDEVVSRHRGVEGLAEILQLIGAASCPDLWHHPAAVRFSLRPFLDTPGWPLSDTTTLAVLPQFDVLERRWGLRGHW